MRIKSSWRGGDVWLAVFEECLEGIKHSSSRVTITNNQVMKSYIQTAKQHSKKRSKINYSTIASGLSAVWRKVGSRRFISKLEIESLFCRHMSFSSTCLFLSFSSVGKKERCSSLDCSFTTENYAWNCITFSHLGTKRWTSFTET